MQRVQDTSRLLEISAVQVKLAGIFGSLMAAELSNSSPLLSGDPTKLSGKQATEYECRDKEAGANSDQTTHFRNFYLQVRGSKAAG